MASVHGYDTHADSGMVYCILCCHAKLWRTGRARAQTEPEGDKWHGWLPTGVGTGASQQARCSQVNDQRACMA